MNKTKLEILTLAKTNLGDSGRKKKQMPHKALSELQTAIKNRHGLYVTSMYGM